MIGMSFRFSPDAIGFDLDYRPVGDAIHQAGEDLASAISSALSGTVFPGMSGPVTTNDSNAVHKSFGEFEFSVTGPDVSKIEEGTKPWDMKPGLLAGPKHRVNKQGEPYNIVPFKHKDMPSVIQSKANGLSLSQIIGKYMDDLGVERNVYNWGDRLGDMSAFYPAGQSFTGYNHKTSRYSGMVNMKDGGYMTFRVVSTKSDPMSWWNPGKDPNPITESVWNFMEPLITAHIENAWMKVFESWLGSPNAP